MKHLSNSRILSVLPAVALAAAMFVGCSSNGVSNDEIAQLQGRYDSIMKQYEGLKSQSSDFDSRMEQKDSTILAQSREIERLLAQLKNAKAQSRAPAATPAGEDQQMDRREVKRLQKELDRKEGELSRLNRELTQQEQELKKLQEEARLATRKVKELTPVRPGEDTKKLEAGNRELAEANAALKAQKEQAEKDLADISRRYRELEAENGELNARIASLNSSIAASASESENAGAEADARIRELTKQNATLERDNEVLNQRFVTQGRKVQTLEAQVEELQAQVKRGTTAGDEAKALEQQMEETRRQIASQQSEIATLQEQLQQRSEALATVREELAAARREAKEARNSQETKSQVQNSLNELQALCDSYAQEIARLKEENAQLKDENSQLRDEIETVRSNAQQALGENSELAQKVALASILVTSDLKAESGKSVVSGTAIKPTEKASQTNVVRITGRILDNNVVDPGTISLYVRIANSGNRVVTDNPENRFDLNGISMQYTMKQDIEYTGYGRNIVMMWKRGQQPELEPGLYWVTLYANGYEIGKTSFVLK